MKIYYRISDKGRRDNKPDYINLTDCLVNFCKHFNINDITVIADNCETDTIDMITTYIPKSQIIITTLGNSGSFQFALKHIIDQKFDDETIIYMIEDDYLHCNGSKQILIEGFKHGDYVSLYDHPDKYLYNGCPNPYVHDGGEYTKVFLTENSHWKYSNSTTMTFATKMKTLTEDYATILLYCHDNIPYDFSMFCDLIQQKGRKLVTPLPGMATHGQLPMFSPLRDWSKE
jgi:hypothetical protein